MTHAITLHHDSDTLPPAHAEFLGRVVIAESQRLEPSTAPLPTILVLDDEDAVRRVIARALTAHGYHVLAAHDTDSALSVARSHPGAIHLLLSDLMLHATSGTDAAIALTAIRPGLRTLFMSGHEPDEDIDDASPSRRMRRFLRKPFSVADLIAGVRAILKPSADHSEG